MRKILKNINKKWSRVTSLIAAGFTALLFLSTPLTVNAATPSLKISSPFNSADLTEDKSEEVLTAATSCIISVSEGSPKVGDSFTVAISLTCSKEIGAYQYNLNYDSAVMEYETGAGHGSNGTVKASGYGNGEISKCTDTFTFVAKTAGISSCSLSGQLMYAYDETLAPIYCESVEITPGGDGKGQIFSAEAIDLSKYMTNNSASPDSTKDNSNTTDNSPNSNSSTADTENKDSSNSNETDTNTDSQDIIINNSNSVTIIPNKTEAEVPEGYNSFDYNLYGNDVTAYRQNQDDEIIMIYGKDKSGEDSLYYYDTKEDTFMRYAGKDSAISQENSTEKSNVSPNKNEQNNKTILLIFVILLTLLFATCVFLAFKMYKLMKEIEAERSKIK